TSPRGVRLDKGPKECSGERDAIPGDFSGLRRPAMSVHTVSGLLASLATVLACTAPAHAVGKYNVLVIGASIESRSLKEDKAGQKKVDAAEVLSCFVKGQEYY